MTESQFTFWLHGFFELTDATTLSEAQVKMIKQHLDLVFNKVTEPLMPLDVKNFKEIIEEPKEVPKLKKPFFDFKRPKSTTREIPYSGRNENQVYC